MAAESFDAALEGQGQYEEKAYFFKDDQYLRYHWIQDRVDQGTLSTGLWGLTGAFASGVDAALNGEAAYAGKAYFFTGGHYLRYDWAQDGIDQAEKPLSAWGLTGAFAAGVDAALNGREAYAGKAYFFKGGHYLRYDWAQDGIDQAEKLLSAWGLTGAFAAGVDAAVNGHGDYAGKVYFFKGDQYVRYDWATDSVDRGPVPMVENWPGLYELMLAGLAKTTTVAWVGSAVAQLTAYAQWLPTGGAYPYDRALMETALAKHFHIDPSQPALTRLPVVASIVAGFTGIQGVLDTSPQTFQHRTDDEALADNMVAKDPATGTPIRDSAGKLVPFHAYGALNGKISFTRLFPTHGPLCRAAEVVHESVHVVNPLSGSKDTHISEWYVTDAEADALGLSRSPEMPSSFATRYDLMTTANAVNNPSAYAAFAEHIHYKADKRYGAGRPNL